MTELDYGDLLKKTLTVSVRGSNILVLVLGALVLAAGSVLTAGILAGPLALGYAGACLKIARGEPVAVSDLWVGFRRFVPALLLSLIVLLASVVGIMAFFVPGVFVLFCSSLAFMEMADDPAAGPWECAQRASRLVQNHFSPVLVVAVLEIFLMGTLGWTTVIGGLVVLAFAFLLDGMLYTKLRTPPEAAAEKETLAA